MYVVVYELSLRSDEWGLYIKDRKERMKEDEKELKKNIYTYKIKRE